MLQPGQIINDTYEVERLLGSGGMADVYAVAHRRMPRRFALKVLRLDPGSRDAFLLRFRREAEILATLQHPNIVDVVDRNQTEDGSPYLVMELLEGEDLGAFLDRTGPLALPVALRIASQIGEALEAAHQVGVVHRDLKPSNIFLSKRGPFPNFVKVLDFGIAKLKLPDSTAVTAVASLMGTPGYMAPEQALGLSDEIDPRTDQFALASVLYEMLTGKPVFYRPGDPIFVTLDRVVNENPPPLPNPQLSQALLRALRKRREERYPTLREFLAAVGATSHTVFGMPPLRSASGSLSQPMGEFTIPPRRVSPAYVGLGLSAATMLGVLMALVVRPSRPPVLGPRPALAAGAAKTDRSAGTVPAKLQPTPAVDSASLAKPAVAGPATKPAESPGAVVVSTAATTPATTTVGATGKSESTVETAHITQRPQRVAFLLPPGLGKAPRVALRACMREHLDGLRGVREGQHIRLERSGSLQVVDAPKAVYQTNFASCVSQAFSAMALSEIPQGVTITTRAIR